MQLLKDRIIKDGIVKEGNVLKVDSFLNHKMKSKLLRFLQRKEFLHCLLDLERKITIKIIAHLAILNVLFLLGNFIEIWISFYIIILSKTRRTS